MLTYGTAKTPMTLRSIFPSSTSVIFSLIQILIPSSVLPDHASASLAAINTILIPPQIVSLNSSLYFDNFEYPFATGLNPSPTTSTVMSTKRITRRIRGDEMAGVTVDDRSRSWRVNKYWMKLEVVVESGLGSRALSRRISDKSVNVPNRPPCSFRGEVSARQGTPATIIGNAAPSATSEDTAASWRPVHMLRWARAPNDKGVEEDRGGI